MLHFAKAYIKAALLCLIMALFNTIPLHAQMGYLDTTYYRGMGVENKANGGIVLPDSSVIIIGKFSYCNERLINSIAKLKHDGTNDYTFNVGSGASDNVNAVVRQSDGKLIIAGDFLKFNGVTVNRVARLNPDGSLDNTFVTGTAFDNSVYDIHLQSDGKIILVGNFLSYNSIVANRIVRLNADGSHDNTFLAGTGANGTVYAIDAQIDNKLIVAGNFNTFNGNTHRRILRLHSNGSADTTFKNFNVGANNYITEAVVLPSGKIMVAGAFTTYDSISASRIARLNPDGSKDATFTKGFSGNIVNEMAVQPDGKVLAIGNFTAFGGVARASLARIDTAGNSDATFLIGSGLNYSSNGVFLDAAGKIYIAGTFTAVDSFARFRFARLLPNGKVDHTFFEDSKFNNAIQAMGKQTTGKMVVAGLFTRHNGTVANRIARLNPDGSFDNTFVSGTGFNNGVRCVVVLPDDRILVSGSFTQYNGKAVNRIVRLFPDGGLDTTFVAGANNEVIKMHVAPDGRIYIGGTFTTYSAVARVRFARIFSNGKLDTTFNVAVNNTLLDIKQESNGKLIICGSFTNVAGVAISRVARIDTTSPGLLDTVSLKSSLAINNTVWALLVQPDGKIVIGGQFTTVNGVSKSRIARLKADGTLDSAFVATANNTVQSLALSPKGIFVGGQFITFNGKSSSRIAFINFTGATDTSFYVGTGAQNFLTGTSSVYAIYPDNVLKKVFIGGNFQAVQTMVANRFARLNNTNLELLTTPTPICQSGVAYVQFIKGANFNPSNSFIIQLSDSSGNFANGSNVGGGFNNTKGLDSIDILIPNLVPNGGNYRLRIISSDPADTSNISGPIYIGPAVPPTITAVGPSAICGGAPVVLQSSVAASYQWSNGQTTRSITVTTPGAYSVTTNTYNCIASSTPTNVIATSAPDSSITASATSFCAGANVVLSARPGLKYNWSTGDTTQSITVTQSGNYSLTVRNTYNCVADSTRAIDFNALNSYLVVAGGPTDLCPGGSVTLSAVPATTYLWSTGATTQSIIVSQSGSYRVTLSDNNCTATSSNTVVTVNSAPPATVTASGPTSFCTGDSVTLTAPAGYNYVWSNSATTQSVTITSSGFYRVTVTDPASNCSASSTLTTVTSTPTPTISFNLPDDTLCNGQSPIQLTAAPGGGTFSGNGVTGTVFNPQGLQNTTAVITYNYSSGSCSGSAVDSAYIDICTGINDVEAGSLSIYPNPATDHLFINSTNVIENIEVTDMLGKVVIKTEGALQSTTVVLDISKLQSGSYFIQIGKSKRKFIKAN